MSPTTSDLPAVVALDTPTLGDRSYLVHDGKVAFVVDPQRDIDRMLSSASDAGVRITHVFETHLHNDYLTGGLALAQATGAAYHVNAADDVAFERVPVGEGDVLEIGERMRLRALPTPGHTFTHLSYVLEWDGTQVGVFTGGSLLFGSTGRPDLLGASHTDELVHHQYASAHRLAGELHDDVEIYPTHGFGSFCSATQSDASASTIGQERRVNPVLTQDEETFVKALLEGLDAWPAYYARMSPANAAGPQAADLTPPERADAAELRRRIDDGEWIVDLRTRTAFAAGHAPGTFNFGLDGNMATYLGWLIPWGTALTLLAETADEIAEAQRELVRIGIDRPAAAATGDPTQWSDRPLSSMWLSSFADLAAVRHHRPVTVLDVRRRLEYEEAHIDGVIHVPLHELPHRMAELPSGEIWVHCAAGYRASIAASLLAAAGHEVVGVDDDFDRAADAGLPLVRGGAAT